MKYVLDARFLTVLIAALVIGGATLATASLANVGPATTTNVHMALSPPVPTNLSAIRTGTHVNLTWSYSGPKVKGFYIFHVASATQPPADWEKGGWSNDTIIDGSLRQADLTPPAATKPNHNYYLICIAGQGAAYFCSAVVMERPNMTIPAPLMRTH